MTVLKQICLIAVTIVFQTNYCNSKNRIWTARYFPSNKEMFHGEIRCARGQKIDLISYKFHHSLTEEEVSGDEKLELYQKCSMQERCYCLEFPSRSYTQTNHTYYLVINYRCLDPKNIMDMCNYGTRIFNDTLPLMCNGSAIILPTKCQCYINGKFSVTLSDVRLGVKQLNTCSSASLKINSKLFKCEEKVSNNYFGSLFQTKIEFNVSFVYILLTLNQSSPTMVWLNIEPTESSTVTCIRTRSSFTTTKITPTDAYLSSILTDHVSIHDNFIGSHERSNKLTHTIVIIIISVCSASALWAVIIGVAIRCKRVKSMNGRRNVKSTNQYQSTEQEQAINPASEVKTDGKYYEMSYKLASADETAHQAYVDSQFHKQGACGYDTEALHPRRTTATYSQSVTGSNALPDERNYYNANVKLSQTHAVYEKIQPQLECNDEEYSELDQ